MLFENVKHENFNHRPLKKRPVPLPKEPTESPVYDDNSEPENLSIKPEDLSKTGNYPSNATSPTIGAAPRRWMDLPSSPPCLPQYHHTYPPIVPLLPPHHMSLPTYLPARLSPQYHPTIPILINNPEQPWSRPSHLYSASLPYHETQHYNGHSPRAACSPPMRSPIQHQSPVSPMSTSSHTSGSEVARPQDLISPVSADSGISTETVPRRRKDPTGPRYQCPDCGKSYSTYSGLTKHRQYHCASAEGNQVKKSFSCKYCHKVYTSLGALKMHIRTHTLPCKCHLCGKAFSRPWLLQGHIRTHTGEKPFSCMHCHRAFADRSNLRAHLQTHSEVKKYSCPTCSKTFSRMSLLIKHGEGGCPGCEPITTIYEYHPEEVAYKTLCLTKTEA